MRRPIRAMERRGCGLTRLSIRRRRREVLMTALEACALNPEVPRFNPGVLQT